MKINLFARRTILLPTWQGWLLIFVLIGGFFTIITLRVNHWLSVTQPLEKGYLVIDGSLPDFAIESAIQHFDAMEYEMMVVTGGPVPVGSYHNKYKTYAEVGHAKLLTFGFDNQKIIVLNTDFALKDRTYHNALTVKSYFDTNNLNANITIFEVGAHARRSRLLFEMAFNQRDAIGIISIDDINFNANKWWASSIGFRSVIGELLAYIYARLFFSP